MMKRIFILVFLFLSKISFANSIVADLSIDSININTGFNGAELFYLELMMDKMVMIFLFL